MICKTVEEAVDLTVGYILAGHKVAYAIGPRHDSRPAQDAVARRIPFAERTARGVTVKGELMMVPRVPFMPGSGLLGWHGAIVLDPSVRGELYAGRLDAVIRLIKGCHAQIGVAS